MEKAKRGERVKTLIHTLLAPVTFEFISPLPFDECVARLEGIRDRFVVTGGVKIDYMYVDDDAYVDYRIRQFHINRWGKGAEVIGRLRAYPHDETTHVEGQAGVGFLNQTFLVILSIIGLFIFPMMLCELSQSWSSRSCCLLIILPIVLSYAWYSDYTHRKKLIRRIYSALEGQFPNND